MRCDMWCPVLCDVRFIADTSVMFSDVMRLCVGYAVCVLLDACQHVREASPTSFVCVLLVASSARTLVCGHVDANTLYSVIALGSNPVSIRTQT